MYERTELGPVVRMPLNPKPRLNGEWKYSPLHAGYKYHWLPTSDPEKNQMVILVSIIARKTVTCLHITS